ncbi:pyocin activator PrtN family protein [Endozoicomonas gorgoniicola]|uniref:Pyocin activator PrtN family protein n=1 Tax=Endozoicomonas gorgoniicola TaxID=1234144 RepID=A0ABT3MW52_9GAMM|nr:pyocin activator PrtN family protein [Endozoicomonas gorgoniicola]MCW7553614.1 pyocin activator PrtN family protein [Endozoicomonas gorgoniicola]
MLTTELMLYGKYKSPVIKLEDCCKEVTGLSYKKACESINKGDWPFPVSRAYASTRAPYLVHIRDLAKYLDDTFASARDDYEKLN